MAMTSSDFEAMAEAMAEAKRYITYATPGESMTATTVRNIQLEALETAVKELATACAGRYRGSYGFKRQRFVEACGFPEA
jgi:hypothetical protein